MKKDEILKPLISSKYFQRNLPHFEHPGSVYFITFKCIQGLILSAPAKTTILNNIKFFADERYYLYCAVVMDTHVHLLIQPLENKPGEYYSLSQIMHSIKSYSSHQIQKIGLHSGKIWQDENYDRVIRDNKEYLETWQYIYLNPVAAGQVENPEDYQWLFVREFE